MGIDTQPGRFLFYENIHEKGSGLGCVSRGEANILRVTKNINILFAFV
jgi:hypothetical protein